MRNRYLLIFTGLGLSLFITILLFKSGLFPDFTPRINPLFIADMSKKIASIFNKKTPRVLNTTASSIESVNAYAQSVINNLPKATPPANAPFHEIVSNVSATEKVGNMRYIKLKKGTKVRVTIIDNPDGSKKTILMPILDEVIQ